MFSRFKGFLIIPGIIVFALLFVWLSWQPYPPINRFIKYKEFFTANEQINTVTVKVIEYNQGDHEVAAVIEQDFNLAELIALMKENPRLILKLDIDSDKLIMAESDWIVKNELKLKLGVAGDYLGIYKQAADGVESLERVSQIKINELPLEWQAVLLEDKLVFDNETALLEALDSLDEYQLH